MWKTLHFSARVLPKSGDALLKFAEEGVILQKNPLQIHRSSKRPPNPLPTSLFMVQKFG